MSILINQNTKFIIQGLGRQGSTHTRLMKNYGTKIVAAVSSSIKDQLAGIPVYPTVKQAAKSQPADFSILFVPAPFAKKSALEALENNLNLIIITEGLPVHDTLEILQKAKEKKLTVLGPNCPGLISPQKAKAGIMPAHIFKKGPVGIVSRSGTLTYEIAYQLSQKGIGQSTVVGIGGDPLIGTDFVQIIKLFEKDAETKSIILIGEIGGNLEEKAAEYLQKHPGKKVVAYIAGRSAPPEKRMGHAGAIIEGKSGNAQSKITALQKAGVKVAKLPSEVTKLTKVQS